MFVWSFSSNSRFLHLFEDVTITGEWLQILAYARQLRSLSCESSLAFHTYWDWDSNTRPSACGANALTHRATNFDNFCACELRQIVLINGNKYAFILIIMLFTVFSCAIGVQYEPQGLHLWSMCKIWHHRSFRVCNYQTKKIISGQI